MSVISSFLAVLCSAALLSLGIPNEYLHFGSAFFGIIALIPLYTSFCISPTRRRTAWMFGAMIAFVHLCSSFWLAYFENFAIFTLGASTAAYFFLGFLFGHWFYDAMKLPLNVRPFAFACLWTLWEWFKGSGFVAYPWGSLSMTTLSLRTLIQIADITGVWGITFLVALISALLAEIIRGAMGITAGLSKLQGRPLVRPLVFTAALLLLVTGYGLFRIHEKRTPQQNLTLVLVQQNTDPWVSGLDLFFDNLHNTQKLTEKAITESTVRPDLIVWNESSLAYGYDQFQDYYRHQPFQESFTDFLQRMNIPILTGSPLLQDAERGKYSNSVYLIAPNGTVLSTYSKIQLICFAEYIPFTDHPFVQRFFDSLVGFSSGWAPGTEYKAMTFTAQNGIDVRFAAPICFEDAFPALCADLHNQNSNILINLTNDSWSKTASAEYQHFAVAYFRAIELRTPLVRSTNGGYTCVVDPAGNITASLPLFTSDALSVSVPVYPYRRTFYAQLKDWLPALFMVIALIAAASFRLSPAFLPKVEADYEPVFAWLTPGLSKNFSFWTVSLDVSAMFKIKSLLYKDLILNSRGWRKSNQLLRHPQRRQKKLLRKTWVRKRIHNS